MIKNIRTLFLSGLLMGLNSVASAYQEPPVFADKVSSGEMPPIDQRLPTVPLLMDESMGNERSGKYGGRMRMIMAKEKDIRRMVVFGYSRLVGYNQDLELMADIVESFEVIDNKEFIFNLREGHRWSDGAPFTAEDFRYYWDHVALNEELTPFGPPQTLLVDGQLPEVETPDPLTVIYRWQSPNPYFLPEIAGPSPLFIYQPKHYLSQFHPEFTDRENLEKKAADEGNRNWMGFYLNKARQYKLTNPELPSLQPWINTTWPPAEVYIFERNPYFHRVDTNGLQMPYIDEVSMNIASSTLIPAKAGAGESDLQGHYLRLDNFPFLKEGEARNPYKVKVWTSVNGAHKALYPNLNSSDPVWRELVRDVRFRRALSMGVDRNEINIAVYKGVANAGNNTVLPASPFYRDELQQMWATYDPDKANQLLDEMGLTERDSKGLRLRPDGKPIEVIVHTSGESTEESDILELIHDTWLKLGIKIYTKPSSREVFRERVFSGEAMMAIWSGLENGMPTPEMSPHELAPTRQDQYQWPKWGQYNETKGEVGEAPDIESAARLFELNREWSSATSSEQREKIWVEMLDTFSSEMFSIGIVNSVPRPIVAHETLVNVPEKGIYSWSPTSYFGVYRPDIFWFEN